MSALVHIDSAAHFSDVLSSSRLVVVDFYADWCVPCKVIAPVYEQLSRQLSRPGAVTFTKVDTDRRKDIAQAYNITAMPTFLIFRAGREIKRVRGADPKALDAAVRQVAAEAANVDNTSGGASSSRTGGGDGGGGGGGGAWSAFSAPRGYSDITDAVDARGLDFLNTDGEFGAPGSIFESGRPSTLEAKGGGTAATKDWIESDTDEQMMLYIPFQSTVKLSSVHITSVASGEDSMRPHVLRFYKNRSTVLGFDEGTDAPFEQEIEIGEKDWDEKTATAKVELRFVRFQNITSVTVFVVSGAEGEEKTRIDRLRFYGETGEKRTMGKLEKVGGDS